MIIVFAILTARVPRCRRWIAGTVAIAVGLSGCGGSEGPVERVSSPARHVVVIVVDTLRADHLPFHGYARDTAPFLQELAVSGTVFTNAVSPSSFTGEAVSTLFTGANPSQTPWGAGWYSRPAPDGPTLATAFQEAGYATAFFSNSPVLDAPAFQRGFDTAWCGTAFGSSGQAPRLVEKATAWLSEHRAESTFLYLHFLDPHGPYAPPAEAARRFGSEEPSAPLALYEEVRGNLPALTESGFGPDDPRYRDLVARYDGEIAFVDSQIRRLFESFERMGIADDLLAVVTADHGEEFLEHGFVEHAWTLYPETYRVPLIFWQPARLPKARVAGTASLVDVMPTVLALQELAVPPSVTGMPLYARRPAGPWVPRPLSGPRILEMVIQSRCIVRGVVTEESLYLAYWKWIPPEARSEAVGSLRATRTALLSGETAPVPTWGPVLREEYYDLRADPGAARNLADSQPEALARWRAYLRDYQAACPPQLPDRFKALRDVAILDETGRALIRAVPPIYLQPRDPDGDHTHALESLGYL